jgi:ATP-dependent RNA circularization protein (DNA/RNA ligase family)
MKEYHKINSIYKRDMSKKTAPFIIGEYAEPEFELLKDIEWFFTEKIDGTNIRIQLSKDGMEFAGRTANAQIPAHLFKRLQEIFIQDKLKEIFLGDWEDICLYGEGFGNKIQGKVGIDYLKDNVDFILFDVRVGNLWLERLDVDDIAHKLNIESVPVVGMGSIDDAIYFVQEGHRSYFGEAQMEGVVLRPEYELLKRRGERIITKVKYRDFSKY